MLVRLLAVLVLLVVVATPAHAQSDQMDAALTVQMTRYVIYPADWSVYRFNPVFEFGVLFTATGAEIRAVDGLMHVQDFTGEDVAVCRITLERGLGVFQTTLRYELDPVKNAGLVNIGSLFYRWEPTTIVMRDGQRLTASR